ncbi:MAG: LptF/LptG family permease [Myxococcota bacterium]|nr:LptF/LptG family permease [Myxococcota bacterium]
MKALDRYLLCEISLPLVVGLGLFFVVVAFGQLMQISDSVTGLGITSSDMLLALGYSIPPLLGILLPVSMLFATMLAVGRMASDREPMGWCAAGGSPYSLLRMPALMGLCLSGLTLLATLFGEPWGVRGIRDLMSESAQQALASGVNTGEFTEWIPGVVFYAADRDGEELVDVFFSDRRDRSQPLTVSAARGKLFGGSEARDIVFELRDGTIWLRDGDGGTQHRVRFERTLYRLDVGKLVGNKAKTLSPVQGKDVDELLAAIASEQEPKHKALLEVTFHRKLALPVAVVIFALLAVPIGCKRGAGARARSFLVSTALVGAYYYIGRAAELQARQGEFPAMLAPWLPNLLGIVALAWMLKRMPRTMV